MRALTVFITIAVITAFYAPRADAQKTTQTGVGGGGTPHVQSERSVDGANLVIEYGRPSLKGRSETQMMPPGEVWRTGADEQTILRTDRPLKFGSLAVPAGTYGLFTVPGPAEWQL